MCKNSFLRIHFEVPHKSLLLNCDSKKKTAFTVSLRDGAMILLPSDFQYCQTMQYSVNSQNNPQISLHYV